MQRLVVVFVMMGILGGVIADQCGSLTCPGQCCNDIYTGPECVYQPELYDCVNGVKLCGKGDGECNGICFNDELYYCLNGHITPLTQSQPCAQINCGSLSCCNDIYVGPQCYDTSIYDCVNGVKLCGEGDGECNGICYNDNLYYCVSGQITPIPQTCSQIDCGSLPCCNDQYVGPQCYDPSIYDCVNDVKLCGEGDGECNGICFNDNLYSCVSGQITPITQSCSQINCGSLPCCSDQYVGPQCYDPSIYDCVNDVKLCGEGDGECNGICYNDELYNCISGQITPKPQSCSQINCGSLPCCSDQYVGPQCYDPSIYDCVSGVKLCGEGDGECNGICYNDELYNCISGQITPKPQSCSQINCGSLPCCSDQYVGPQCYDPSIYDCVSGVKLCGEGDGQCNGICYNDELYNCISGQITPKPQSCSQINCGSLPCCSDIYVGPQCYNPSIYDCVNGVKLCGEGDGECNGICYNDELYNCVSGQITPKPQSCSQINCGSLPCCSDQYVGPQCYNPSIFDCVNGVKLCGEGDGECNGICFNDNLYWCNNGAITPL